MKEEQFNSSLFKTPFGVRAIGYFLLLFSVLLLFALTFFLSFSVTNTTEAHATVEGNKVVVDLSSLDGKNSVSKLRIDDRDYAVADLQFSGSEGVLVLKETVGGNSRETMVQIVCSEEKTLWELFTGN